MSAPAIGKVKTRIWFPWQPGPDEKADGPLIVSLTDYTMHSLRSLPGIAAAGARLGFGWYGLPGAVGLYLWADPVHRRTGSLSIWTDRAAMYRWVGLPLHVAIMRRYRTRGSVRATTWESDGPGRDQIREAADLRLAARDF